MKIFQKNTFHTLLTLMVIFFLASCAPKDRYITISGYAQGGTYAVKLNLNGSEGRIKISPETIRDSVDAILVRIDKSMSGYNRNSLLSDFNAGKPIIPDEMFLEIYSHGQAVYDETEGVVDVASGPLFDLWGFGFKSGDFPSDEVVEKTRKDCGMDRLHKDMGKAMGADGRLESDDLLIPGEVVPPVLNYNAIAQGYSCDKVAEYLYSIGVKDMMVDIGEIFCDGQNPSGQPWSLGIDKPVDGNNEPGAQIQGIFRCPSGPHGIVTSGNYRKFYIRDGKKYAHSIDPRTGHPVTHNLLSATIVAPDALTADAYATYCMVVGLEEAKALLKHRQDLEGCLIYDDNGTYRTWCSEGFVLEEI